MGHRIVERGLQEVVRREYVRSQLFIKYSISLPPTPSPSTSLPPPSKLKKTRKNANYKLALISPFPVTFFSWKTCSTLSRAEHRTTRCPSASGSSAVPLRSNSNLTGLFLSLRSARSSLDTKSCSVARTGLNDRGYDACVFPAVRVGV